ncbi:MAG TPA: hypothetical protein VFT65_08075, partial [Candidatus Angelobacter sp.]|nr:hypothetical protein [Candidatus Angelobacter sp.]
VWDSRDGHLLITLGHPDTVNDVEFSPDGQQILTRNRDDGKAWIWNAANGSMLATLQDPSSNIRTARFSPDGRSIITANKENEVRIWNSSDGTLMGSLQGHTANVWDARFSEDSQHIVTASLDSTARVWQLVTLADIDKLLGH